MVTLREHQKDALRKLHNGCVLFGGTGSGKGYTALHYYVQNESPKNLYVITTARKRDDRDWEHEAESLKIFPRAKYTQHGTITVDSWNNIGKYLDVEDAFFIFDEQRAVGRGKWAKTFVKIAKKNHWILLSATPGDTWSDYVPLFVANGFFKNRTEFQRSHVIFKPYLKYPVIDRYINERKLELLRNRILVEMPYVSTSDRVLEWVEVSHNEELMKLIMEKRWNPFEDVPIRDAGEMFRLMRQLVNTSPSRIAFLRKVVKAHKRVIVYYNFDYELELLRLMKLPKISGQAVPILEYNGHKKQELPNDGPVVYLVQYLSGSEAWNCNTVDAMVFYSLTYSWKNFHQAHGRIDRLDGLFDRLYYYYLVSNSKIDDRIRASLDAKKDFNELEFIKEEGISFGNREWLGLNDLSDFTR